LRQIRQPRGQKRGETLHQPPLFLEKIHLGFVSGKKEVCRRAGIYLPGEII
jgi:hypothetical protein